MSAVQSSGEHRVTSMARSLRDELAPVAGVPLWSMSAAEAGDALVLLTQARSQLDALMMRVLQQASVAGTGSGVGLTPAAWWAKQTRTTRAEAHRMVRLAQTLERHEGVASGWRPVICGSTRRG